MNQQCADTFVLDLLISCYKVKVYLSPDDYQKNDKIIIKYFQEL